MFKLIYKYHLHLIAGLVIASLLLWFFNLSTPAPSIASTSPSAGDVNVLLNAPITLTFASAVSSSERRRLTFVFTPSFVFSPRWDQTNTTLTLYPSRVLTKNTPYSLQVNYKNKPLYSLSFTSNPYDDQDLREQSYKQSQDDLIYAQKVEDLLVKYPWYAKLPIITPDYYIFYSFVDHLFKISFTTPHTKELEQQAVADLKKIGVSAKELQYLVLQESPPTNP